MPANESGTTNRRSLFVIMITASAAAVALGLLPVARATDSVNVTRFDGTDRYDTARKVAEGTFTTGADTVVLARGEDFPDGRLGFPDALAGSYLAGQSAGPVLLTQSDSVPAATSEALRTLKTKNVFILGGTSAVSAAVENDLAATDSTSMSGGKLVVTRIGGTDRYDTAKLVAEQPGKAKVGTLNGRRTALVASGENFPDALAGGPVAFASHFPLLLTPHDSLSPSASEALTSLGIQHVVLLGGSTAVNDSVSTAITEMGITVERLSGADRQGTAVAIADFETSQLSFVDSRVSLARGDAYPDALAGGPHAGSEGPSPIVLTLSPDDLSTETRTWIRDHNESISSIDVFGGTGAVSDATVADAKGTATCQQPTTTTPVTVSTTTTTAPTTTLPPCSTTTT
jgi:putative cell wall-binding protein